MAVPHRVGVPVQTWTLVNLLLMSSKAMEFLKCMQIFDRFLKLQEPR
ncbi:MAG TPA: hypothetical protein PK866_02105 [Nitrospira sp.]|nr:hypothetical protein [Nitrospira sp.]